MRRIDIGRKTLKAEIKALEEEIKVLRQGNLTTK